MGTITGCEWFEPMRILLALLAVGCLGCEPKFRWKGPLLLEGNAFTLWGHGFVMDARGPVRAFERVTTAYSPVTRGDGPKRAPPAQVADFVR